MQLNFDVSKIKWEPFIQNHAYGVKKYILLEEAYMPSAGYKDAKQVMFTPLKGILPTLGLPSPWSQTVFFKKVASFDETYKIVFSSKWVQSEIDKLVKKRVDEANK